jgi:hypothetical protein
MKNNHFLLMSILLLLISCGKTKDKETTSVGSDGTSTKRYIRKNAHSPEAEKDLEALAKAMEIMRQKDCSDPLSWYYQGAIHWVPDTVQNNTLCKSYQNMADLKTAWNNCTHTESGVEELHFLLWHRLYILHFERIVRKLSGYEDFALPYWGYTNKVDSILNRTMPKPYRTKNSPLYEASRFDSINLGYPIQGDAVRALSIGKLLGQTEYRNFCEGINSVPHGAMHNYIGHGNIYGQTQYFNPIYNLKMDDGLMGEVPSAGFDPIFWAHHANIDRIWQQWTNSDNGKIVCLDSLKQHPWKYQFFDENGKEVVYTMDEVYNMIYDLMDYDYDDTQVKGKREIPNCEPIRLKSAQDNKLAEQVFNQKVDGGIKTSKLSNKKVKSAIPLLSSTNKTGNRIILTVTLEITPNPRGNYEVYLNVPPKVNPTPDDKYFCGFMTFFGANHHHHSDNHGKKMTMNKTFDFDITNEINDTKAIENKDFNLTVLRFGEKVKEGITIKKINISTR